MWAEQAVFTSLPRRGKGGYHLVARSPGVTDAEAGALAAWSPSHGALILDESNRTSVSFHGLPGGRFALARTCEGSAEYSGRGGRQLYTHILVVDEAALRRADNLPTRLYRDALALGHLHYRPDPPSILRPARLSSTYAAADPAYWHGRASALGLASIGGWIDRLAAGEPVALAYGGDRLELAECLLALSPLETRLQISFATSLRPSVVRPFQLLLAGGGG